MGHGPRLTLYFFQRAFAAFKAIVFRRLTDSFLALACPPLVHRDDHATAAASLWIAELPKENRLDAHQWPSTVRRAAEIKSGCFVLYHALKHTRPSGDAIGSDFKLTHCPDCGECIIKRDFFKRAQP